MKSVEQILEILKSELAYQNATEFPQGISNISYLLDSEYFVKMTYDDNFLLCSDNILHRAAEEAGIGLKIFDFYSSTEYQVSQYQKDLKSYPLKQLTNEQLAKVVKAVKIFHSLPTDTIPVRDIYQLINSYLQIRDNDLRDFASGFKLPSDRFVTCHLDLVEGNILFDSKGEVHLIDYDLTIVGYEYYDLVSLLSENDLSLEQQRFIIEEYYRGDRASIGNFEAIYPVMRFLFDVLWYSWSLARLTGAPSEKVEHFISIARAKKERADRFVLKCIKDRI